jgi:hypothetical protein
LIKGLLHGKLWVGRALRALTFDRSAYSEVARDSYMTGPALLLGAVGVVLNGLLGSAQTHAGVLTGLIIVWPLLVLLLYMSGRVLGGQGTYSSTFRVTGFAFGGFLLLLLSLFPGTGALIRSVAALWVFLNVWLGAAQAQRLHGWRTLLLPIIYLIVVAVVGVVLRALFLGAGIALESLWTALGL